MDCRMAKTNKFHGVLLKLLSRKQTYPEKAGKSLTGGIWIHSLEAMNVKINLWTPNCQAILKSLSLYKTTTCKNQEGT